MKALWPLLALFSLSCVSVAAAQLPEAPQPGVRPDVYSRPPSALRSLFTSEHVWLTLDLGSRIGDYTSTQQALRNGGREAELPLSLVRNKPVMLGYELSYVASEYRTMRWLDRHRHHRMALLLPAIDAAVVGVTDWHNYTITGNGAGQPPRGLTPSPLPPPGGHVPNLSSPLP